MYSYGSPLYYLGQAGGVTGMFIVMAIILAIVLFAMCCTKNADHSKPLTRFFSFDHLFIEGIMKFLYVLSVTTIAAICIAMPISAALVAGNISGGGGIGVFFGTLLVAIFLFFVLQFLNRVLFEWAMMFVRGAVDIHDIRNKMLGTADPEYDDQTLDRVSAAAGAGFAAAKSAFSKANESWQASKTTGHAPQAGHPAQPVQPPYPAQPTQPVAGAGATWDCSCGRRGNKGAFCGQCGRPRP